MKPNLRFRIYGLTEAFVVVLVILLFKAIPERRAASMVATMLFLGVPIFFMAAEARYEFKKSKLIFWLGHLQFLVCFAFPIFYLNFLSSVPHSTIAGFTLQDFHQASNLSYFATILSSFIVSFIEARALAMNK